MEVHLNLSLSSRSLKPEEREGGVSSYTPMRGRSWWNLSRDGFEDFEPDRVGFLRFDSIDLSHFESCFVHKPLEFFQTTESGAKTDEDFTTGFEIEVRFFHEPLRSMIARIVDRFLEIADLLSGR